MPRNEHPSVLTRTDKRIMHQRLVQLDKHLQLQLKNVSDRFNDPIHGRDSHYTKTRFERIVRRFKINLTAVDLLITYLNFENNGNKEITSFRKSSDLANGVISKITNGKTPVARRRVRIKRTVCDRGSIRGKQSEYGRNNECQIIQFTPSPFRS